MTSQRGRSMLSLVVEDGGSTYHVVSQQIVVPDTGRQDCYVDHGGYCEDGVGWALLLNAEQAPSKQDPSVKALRWVEAPLAQIVDVVHGLVAVDKICVHCAGAVASAAMNELS